MSNMLSESIMPETMNRKQHLHRRLQNLLYEKLQKKSRNASSNAENESFEEVPMSSGNLFAQKRCTQLANEVFKSTCSLNQTLLYILPQIMSKNFGSDINVTSSLQAFPEHVREAYLSQGARDDELNHRVEKLEKRLNYSWHVRMLLHRRKLKLLLELSNDQNNASKYEAFVEELAQHNAYFDFSHIYQKDHEYRISINSSLQELQLQLLSLCDKQHAEILAYSKAMLNLKNQLERLEECCTKLYSIFRKSYEQARLVQETLRTKLPASDNIMAESEDFSLNIDPKSSLTVANHIFDSVVKRHEKFKDVFGIFTSRQSSRAVMQQMNTKVDELEQELLNLINMTSFIRI